MAENVTATTNTQETVQESTQETVDTSALQAELERLKGENAKLKNAQSNASSDAAKYKRELQARMSEQEREANQTKELIEQLKADNAALKRAQTLAEQDGLAAVRALTLSSMPPGFSRESQLSKMSLGFGVLLSSSFRSAGI